MSVLIGQTPFLIQRPTGQPDAHGWIEPDYAPAGSVLGSLQEQQPVVDPAYSGAGGGPQKPAILIQAVAYLDGPVREGDRISVPGQSAWLVRRVRLISDQMGTGLDCWQADLSEAVAR